jgi:hypothetical protein
MKARKMRWVAYVAWRRDDKKVATRERKGPLGSMDI